MSDRGKLASDYAKASTTVCPACGEGSVWMIEKDSFLAGYDARNDEMKREFKEGMFYAAVCLLRSFGEESEKYADFIQFMARENK